MEGNELLALLTDLEKQEAWEEAFNICSNNLFGKVPKCDSLKEQTKLALSIIKCGIKGINLQHLNGPTFITEAILSLKEPLLSLDESNRKNKFQSYMELTELYAQHKYYSELDEQIQDMGVKRNFSLGGIYMGDGTFASYRLGYDDLRNYYIIPGFSRLAEATQLSYTQTSHRADAMHVTSDKIFAKAMNYVVQITSVSSDFPYFFNPDVAELYFAATFFISYSFNEVDNLEETVIFERHKLCAELYCDLLNAILVRNGSNIPLVFEEALRKQCFDSILYHEKKCQNIDGTYTHPPVNRETRSTQSNQTSTGGCYVATAVYGSYDCPEVWTLRRYRDDTLASTWYGRAFIRTYYAISPSLCKWFGHTMWFKKMWKGKLDRMVASLQKNGVASTPYEDQTWNQS